MKDYLPMPMSEKFYIFAGKIKALEEFKEKYCSEEHGRTATISRNCKSYIKIKNNLKKEILNELGKF